MLCPFTNGDHDHQQQHHRVQQIIPTQNKNTQIASSVHIYREFIVIFYSNVTNVWRIVLFCVYEMTKNELLMVRQPCVEPNKFKKIGTKIQFC